MKPPWSTTDGGTLNHNDAVVFEATVEDNEDLPNEIGLSWESDLDGVFSTDGADSSGAVTVSIDALSPGDHVVTVTATDTDGLYVTDTVSFNLNQPPTTPTVTLEPDPAATNQMLVATASGSEDPEGTGTVTYAYEWFEDGVLTAESASATFPAGATGKNHTYRVQVTASDGLVESAFGYAEASVINSAPALVGPTLSAATATVCSQPSAARRQARCDAGGSSGIAGRAPNEGARRVPRPAVRCAPLPCRGAEPSSRAALMPQRTDASDTFWRRTAWAQLIRNS